MRVLVVLTFKDRLQNIQYNWCIVSYKCNLVPVVVLVIAIEKFL